MCSVKARYSVAAKLCCFYLLDFSDLLDLLDGSTSPRLGCTHLIAKCAPLLRPRIWCPQTGIQSTNQKEIGGTHEIASL